MGSNSITFIGLSPKLNIAFSENLILTSEINFVTFKESRKDVILIFPISHFFYRGCLLATMKLVWLLTDFIEKIFWEAADTR